MAEPAPASDESLSEEVAVPTEELWRQYHANGDEEARQELMRRHQQVVRYIAEHQASKLPRSVDVDDLMQEGNIGLDDAIKKFDPSVGVKFKTYCGTRVRGAMLDYLRALDWVPRQKRSRAQAIERFRIEFVDEHGREPALGEVARALSITEKDVRDAAPRMMHSLSDRRIAAGEDGEGQIDTLGESVEGSPIDVAHNKDLLEALTNSLSEKERGIIYMYYKRGLTLREIGERLSITESRVCQIHSNVIKRLRQRFEDDREQFEA